MPKRTRPLGSSQGTLTKRTKGNRRNAIPRFPRSQKTILGKTIKSTLRYHTTVALDTSVAPVHHVFSANGVYDPDITGIGHQPRGFDQLMALYDHVVVTRSKIRVWWFTAPTSSNQGGNIVISLRQSSTVPTFEDDVFEYGPKKVSVAGASDGGKGSGYIEYSANPNTFLGRSGVLQDPNLKNSASGNPSEQAYWIVTNTAVPTLTDSPAVRLRVEIVYDCVAIEPKQPSAS